MRVNWPPITEEWPTKQKSNTASNEREKQLDTNWNRRSGVTRPLTGGFACEGLGQKEFWRLGL